MALTKVSPKLTSFGETHALDIEEATLVAARARDASGVVPQQFGDGALGWQVAINAAISAVSNAGGGKVVLPRLSSPYEITAPIILRSRVHLDLGGNTISLASGSNCNVIESEDYLTLTGVNSGAGISAVRVGNGDILGNRGSNPTGGHGVAVFGRDFLIHDLMIRAVQRRGLHTEYGTSAVGTSPFNGRIENITVVNCGEEGWVNDVSDLQWYNVNIASPSQNADNGFDAIVLNRGTRGTMGAIWLRGSEPNRHRYGVRMGNGNTLVGINVETAATAAWRVDGSNCHVTESYIYNNQGAANIEVAGNSNRIQARVNRSTIGEATAATVALVGAASYNDIDVNTSGLTGPAVEFRTYTGTYNAVRVRGQKDSGPLLSGAPVASDAIDISMQVGTALVELLKDRIRYATTTAAGSTQADAAALTRVYNNVAGSDGTKGVVLPTGIEGQKLTISNVTPGAALLVYPALGQSIVGVPTNVAYSLPGAGGISLIYHGGRWVQI